MHIGLGREHKHSTMCYESTEWLTIESLSGSVSIILCLIHEIILYLYIVIDSGVSYKESVNLIESKTFSHYNQICKIK